MSHAILGRWGKNLALRLPNEIASELSLREGERVEIVSGAGQITIRRAGRAIRGKNCSPANPPMNGATSTPMHTVGAPIWATRSLEE